MAHSPFEVTTQRLGGVVAALAPRAQTLFFCCAARTLLAGAASDVENSLSAAQQYALTGAFQIESRSCSLRWMSVKRG